MHRYTSGDLVGEYIHYHYSNYEKYGLIVRSRPSGKDRAQLDLSSALEEQRKKVYSLLNKQYNAMYYKKLEEQLNYITSNGEQGSSNLNIEKIQQEVLKSKIEAIHNIQFDSSDINWNTLSLTSAGRSKLLRAKVDSAKLASYLEKSGIPPEKVSSFMLSIGSLLNSQMGKGQHHFSISNVNRHIANIKGLISSVTDANTAAILTKRIQAVEAELRNIDSTDLSSFNEKRFDGKRNIREELRQIARTTLTGATVSMIEGDLAEALVDVVASAMGGVAKAGVDDVMTSFLGPLRSENVYRSSSFGSLVKTDQLFGAQHFERQGGDEDNELYWKVKSFKGTQGKTDVSITLTSNGAQLESNASIKNYNLDPKNTKMRAKGLSLVSGTNMVYLLQHNAKFLNHYLNQTARKGTPDGAPTGVVWKANKMMQEMMLLLAFSGGGDKANISLSRKHAGIFIINDKSKGKGGFKIVPVTQLYEQLLSMKDSFNITLPNNQSWSNIWVDRSAGGKGQRITNLLAEVMRHKISVSVKMDKMQSALNSIKT